MPATATSSAATVTNDSHRDVMRRIGRHRLLTAQEEVKLAKRIERGDLKAKECLMEHNYLLVNKIAFSYQNQGLPLSDLFDEGVEGLIRAAEKFDWRKGFKFSTYATPWIHQSMQRAIKNIGHTIRIPVHKGEALRKVVNQRRRLTAELGYEPSIQELSEHLGWSAEEMKDTESLLRASRQLASLDKPIGDGGTTTLGEMLEDTGRPSAHEETVKSLRNARLLELVEELPEEEARVLKWYCGLGGQRAITLQGIARQLDVTIFKVQRLRDKGLRRLASEHGSELRALFGDDLSGETLSPRDIARLSRQPNFSDSVPSPDSPALKVISS